MKTTLSYKPLSSTPLALIALLGLGTLAYAQDANWTGATSTDWNTGSNWSSSSVPTGTGTFGLTGSHTVDLGSATSVGGMVFKAGSTGTWVFAGSPLTLTSAAMSSGNRPIQINANNMDITYQNQVVFNSSAASSFSQVGFATSASTVKLNFDGGISGSGASDFAFRTSNNSFGAGLGATITVKGDISNIATFGWYTSNNTLNISGSSSVSVETLIGGTNTVLQLGNNGALGSGTLNLNSGAGITVQAVGANRTYSNNLNFNGGYSVGGTGSYLISGDKDLTFSGTSAISRDAVITVSTGRRFELGNTSGSKSIFKDGAGTMVLSGSIAHSGFMTVSGGEFLINGTVTGGATPTVNVTGAGVLGGNGTINRSVIFSDNGSGSGILNPGDALVNGGIGTLTVASAGVAARTVTFVGASQLNFDLKSLAEYDKLNISGNLTLDGVLNINSLGLDEIGSFKLISYTGTFVDNGLILGSTPAGWEQSIRVDTASKSVYLDVTAIPEPSTYALLSGAAALALVFGRGKAGKRTVA